MTAHLKSRIMDQFTNSRVRSGLKGMYRQFVILMLIINRVLIVSSSLGLINLPSRKITSTKQSKIKLLIVTYLRNTTLGIAGCSVLILSQ